MHKTHKLTVDSSASFISELAVLRNNQPYIANFSHYDQNGRMMQRRTRIFHLGSQMAEDYGFEKHCFVDEKVAHLVDVIYSIQMEYLSNQW